MVWKIFRDGIRSGRIHRPKVAAKQSVPRSSSSKLPPDGVDSSKNCQGAIDPASPQFNEPNTFKGLALHVTHAVFGTGKDESKDTLTLLESLQQKISSQGKIRQRLGTDDTDKKIEASDDVEVKATDKLDKNLFSKDESLAEETSVRSTTTIEHSISPDDKLLQKLELDELDALRHSSRYPRNTTELMFEELAKKYLASGEDDIDKRLCKDMERIGLPIDNREALNPTVNVTYEQEKKTPEVLKFVEPLKTEELSNKNPQYYEELSWCNEYFDLPRRNVLNVAGSLEQMSLDNNNNKPNLFYDEMIPINCCMEYGLLGQGYDENSSTKKIGFENYDDMLPFQELQCKEFNQIDLELMTDDPQFSILDENHPEPFHFYLQGNLVDDVSTDPQPTVLSKDYIVPVEEFSNQTDPNESKAHVFYNLCLNDMDTTKFDYTFPQYDSGLQLTLSQPTANPSQSQHDTVEHHIIEKSEHISEAARESPEKGSSCEKGKEAEEPSSEPEQRSEPIIQTLVQSTLSSNKKGTEAEESKSGSVRQTLVHGTLPNYQIGGESEALRSESEQKSEPVRKTLVQYTVSSYQKVRESEDLNSESEEPKSESEQKSVPDRQTLVYSTLSSYQKPRESEELKSESGELKSESRELKSESGELKSESGELKSESEELKSESDELKSESDELKSESGEHKSELEKKLKPARQTLVHSTSTSYQKSRESEELRSDRELKSEPILVPSDRKDETETPISKPEQLSVSVGQVLVQSNPPSPECVPKSVEELTNIVTAKVIEQMSTFRPRKVNTAPLHQRTLIQMNPPFDLNDHDELKKIVQAHVLEHMKGIQLEHQNTPQVTKKQAVSNTQKRSEQQQVIPKSPYLVKAPSEQMTQSVLFDKALEKEEKKPPSLGTESIVKSCMQTAPDSAFTTSLDNSMNNLDLDLNLSLSELLRRVRARNRLKYLNEIQAEVNNNMSILNTEVKPPPTDRPKCPPAPDCPKPRPPLSSPNLARRPFSSVPTTASANSCPPPPPPKSLPDPPKCPPDPPKCSSDPPKATPCSSKSPPGPLKSPPVSSKCPPDPPQCPSSVSSKCSPDPSKCSPKPPKCPPDPPKCPPDSPKGPSGPPISTPDPPKCPPDPPKCPPDPSKCCPKPPKCPSAPPKSPPAPPKCPPAPPKCPPDPSKCSPDPPKCPPPPSKCSADEKPVKAKCPACPPKPCPPPPPKCCTATKPDDPVTIPPHLTRSDLIDRFNTFFRTVLTLLNTGLLKPRNETASLKLNRVKDFDPWVPIPSIPHHPPKKPKKPPPPLGSGCPFHKPGLERPPCPELPCAGFPKRLSFAEDYLVNSSSEDIHI